MSARLLVNAVHRGRAPLPSSAYAMTLAEIAEVEGVSRAMIQHIINSAFRKMRRRHAVMLFRMRRDAEMLEESRQARLRGRQ